MTRDDWYWVYALMFMSNCFLFEGNKTVGVVFLIGSVALLTWRETKDRSKHE